MARLVDRLNAGADPEVVIIGAGAAGLVCAAAAARRGRRVLVLEKNARAGAKLRLTGGGRCNCTNRQCGTEHFISANPRFTVSALQRYTPMDFLDFLTGCGIPAHEEEGPGRMFGPPGGAELITDALEKAAVSAGARFAFQTAVQEVRASGGLQVITDSGSCQPAAVVVAAGSPACPASGASDLGYMIAAAHGINVIAPRPGLVPLMLSPADRPLAAALSGIAVAAAVSTGGHTFTDALLFTHRGLSGPAALQISSFWQPGEALTVDLLPGGSAEQFLRERRGARTRAQTGTVLRECLPERLVRQFLPLELRDKGVSQLTREEMRKIAACLHAWQLIPAGTAGYTAAEVAVGGVDTSEISSRTFQARRVPGLFFIGEVLDVTGHLGGYNLQWAWSSGRCAGETV